MIDETWAEKVEEQYDENEDETQSRKDFIDLFLEVFKINEDVMEFLNQYTKNYGFTLEMGVDSLIEENGFTSSLKIIAKLPFDQENIELIWNSSALDSISMIFFGTGARVPRMWIFDSIMRQRDEIVNEKEHTIPKYKSNGWVSPELKVYPCGIQEHLTMGDKLKEELNLPISNSSPDHDLLELGWLKISQEKLSYRKDLKENGNMLGFISEYISIRKIKVIQYNGKNYKSFEELLKKVDY